MKSCCEETPALLAPPPITPPVEWCVLNYTLRYKDGRVTKVPRSGPVQDGVYTNATIRVEAGCIVAITNGESVLYSACDPCLTPIPPPVNGGIDISGNVCNLSQEAPEGLLTTINTIPSNCVQLLGCGTYGSPLQPVLRLSSQAGNVAQCLSDGLFVAQSGQPTGVNFIGCGMIVSNGVITSLPIPYQPVLSLISSDGSVIIQRDGSNPCLVNLQAVPPTGTTSGLGGALVVATPGALPIPPTNINFVGLVGAANPLDVYVYVPSVIGWRQVLGATVNL